MQYPYDPGILPGSANQCILGKVYLDPIYQGNIYQGSLVDVVADKAGSVVAAVDGAAATWGAAGWVRPWRGAIAATAGRLDLEFMWQGCGCWVAKGVLATSSGL